MPILPYAVNIHFHNNFSIAREISKLSGLKSNGFVLNSSSSDFSVNNTQNIDVKKNSSSSASVPDDEAIELQVQSRYLNSFKFDLFSFVLNYADCVIGSSRSEKDYLYS